MNHSNWYGMETMAREQQAEIEKQLRQAAEIRNVRPTRQDSRLKYRWIAVAAAALSAAGTIASVMVAHAR